MNLTITFYVEQITLEHCLLDDGIPELSWTLLAVQINGSELFISPKKVVYYDQNELHM
jgi:hypothetical protein